MRPQIETEGLLDLLLEPDKRCTDHSLQESSGGIAVGGIAQPQVGDTHGNSLGGCFDRWRKAIREGGLKVLDRNGKGAGHGIADAAYDGHLFLILERAGQSITNRLIIK